jgi:hypothetical protein
MIKYILNSLIEQRFVVYLFEKRYGVPIIQPLLCSRDVDPFIGTSLGLLGCGLYNFRLPAQRTSWLTKSPAHSTVPLCIRRAS